MVNPYLDMIGSPRYPLNSPSKLRVFLPEKATALPESPLADLLRVVHKRKPFTSGLCYQNTEQVVRNAHSLDYRVESYAGWLLIGNTDPIHHCWAVYEGQVIDFSTVKNASELEPAFRAKWEVIGKERAAEANKLPTQEAKKEAWITYQIEHRKAWIEEVRPFEEGDIIKNRVWGIPPSSFVYAGCPCTPDNARLIFRRWHSKYGKETSYEGPGSASLTQLIENGHLAEARSRLSGMIEQQEQEDKEKGDDALQG